MKTSQPSSVEAASARGQRGEPSLHLGRRAEGEKPTHERWRRCVSKESSKNTPRLFDVFLTGPVLFEIKNSFGHFWPYFLKAFGDHNDVLLLPCCFVANTSIVSGSPSGSKSFWRSKGVLQFLF